MNNITLNWSAEDRARIDKLIGLLEDVVAIGATKCHMERVTVEEDLPLPGQVTMDEIATETPQEVPQEVEQEQTPQEPETAQDEPREVKNEEITEEDIRLTTNLDACEPTVSKQDILQKVIALCGAGKKAEAKDIITTYADSVSDLPDCALDEVWGKLTALEG